jgi:hypothetical protein
VVISKLLKYAPALAQNCSAHSYVMAYQQSDYDNYNRNPEVADQFLDRPPQASDDKPFEWLEVQTQAGIWSTTVKMDTSVDPEVAEPEDIGCQYRVTLRADGSYEIFSTVNFDEFLPVARPPE